MVDLATQKKTKINLSDFDFKKDIQNRLFMANFSMLEVQILEEILFSPLKISLMKLADRLELEISEIRPFLEKLQKIGLLSIYNDDLLIDKEMRKYYEFQISKFDDDFKPDMEFLQGLLRKVPIQVLPIWYSLPRTSNNIFQSILEKYLMTPQLYQRYLFELQSIDPVFSGIIKDVHQSVEKKVAVCVLKEKYDLSSEAFEEYMLLLEFSFACCLSYSKIHNHYEGVVTPFYEWREYLCFLEKTTLPVFPEEKVQSYHPEPFSFIQDISCLLEMLQISPLSEKELEQKLLEKGFDFSYIQRMLKKLCLIRFIEKKEDIFGLRSSTKEWMSMNNEHKALHLYRHPLNQLLTMEENTKLCTEKNIRAAEKCICRALHGSWVKFDDAIKGAITAFGEASFVQLRNKGKNWKYDLPIFSEEEIEFAKIAVFEGLFEAGIVMIGQDKEHNAYFRVTDFGRSLFEV